MTCDIIVVIGAGGIGQAIARRQGFGMSINCGAPMLSFRIRIQGRATSKILAMSGFERGTSLDLRAPNQAGHCQTPHDSPQ